MREITHTVKDPEGVHALTAGGLIKIANEYSCGITAKGNGGSVDLKDLFAVMTLGIKCGEVITITCDGDDEAQAEAALQRYMQVNL
ncbi:HPr family phosphocarrier protein [Butyrivibrio sp. MB2005]|uniref:HPr family phosphocarrier protein n=1 Tax=Butyrivibrio sp. MB2005 TaxID=1280678 RepID=UPI0004207843|nr:HPr family phosphocarrier protein [Butyrivibrio sp. MB2005]